MTFSYLLHFPVLVTLLSPSLFQWRVYDLFITFPCLNVVAALTFHAWDKSKNKQEENKEDTNCTAKIDQGKLKENSKMYNVR